MKAFDSLPRRPYAPPASGLFFRLIVERLARALGDGLEHETQLGRACHLLAEVAAKKAAVSARASQHVLPQVHTPMQSTAAAAEDEADDNEVDDDDDDDDEDEELGIATALPLRPEDS